MAAEISDADLMVALLTNAFATSKEKSVAQMEAHSRGLVVLGHGLRYVATDKGRAAVPQLANRSGGATDAGNPWG